MKSAAMKNKGEKPPKKGRKKRRKHCVHVRGNVEDLSSRQSYTRYAVMKSTRQRS